MSNSKRMIQKVLLTENKRAEIAELEREFDRDRNETDNQCCSCHINPPCSYCTSKNEEDYE